jgi:hypothetical protein
MNNPEMLYGGTERQRQKIKHPLIKICHVADHLIPEMDQLWLFLFMVVWHQEECCNAREWLVLYLPLGSNRGRLIFLCCADVILWKCFHSNNMVMGILTRINHNHLDGGSNDLIIFPSLCILLHYDIIWYRQQVIIRTESYDLETSTDPANRASTNMTSPMTSFVILLPPSTCGVN